MTEYANTGRYILYGAVANRPKSPSFNLRTQLKYIIDRIAFRVGYKSQLNYKNYQEPYTYNRGDHSIIVATAQQLKKINPQLEIIATDWEQLDRAEIRSADKILICGSGYFFPNPQGIFPQRLQRDLEIIEDSGAELHFLGVGYNYLLDWKPQNELVLPESSIALLKRLLSRTTTLTVRDENTKKFLSTFTDKEIEVVGDPALFIDTALPHNCNKGRSRRLQIGINIPFHGHEPTEWVKNYLVEFIDFLRDLKELTDCNFTYFIHYDSEVLIANLIRDRGVSVAIIDTDASNLPLQYSKMDIHLGGMLHSCIIATAAGVPCIGMAYDEKHFGFFELMQRSDYCLRASPFNAQTLLQAILRLQTESANECSRIRVRHQQLASKFQRAVKVIINYG